jgi:predicted metal-dependent phosphoesterase TrpH
MKGFADLHIHSIYSDGILTPEEIFQKAATKGIKCVSFTDHDTVDGCVVGHTVESKYNVELVDGIEMSCYEDGREYHILGYYIDIDNKILKNYLEEFRRARLIRAEKIIKKLRSLNVPLTFEEILEQAGEAPVARPHIAMVMLEKGYASSFKEAFLSYLGEGRPAYESKMQFPVLQAIKLIKECNGISILAHPSRSVSQETMYKFIELGIDGVEVVHPMHDKEMQKYYHDIAAQYWLIETGGSDFHGTRDFDEPNFGKFTVPCSVVDSLRTRAGKK